MAKPEVGCSQLGHGEKVGRVLFVARGEPSEVLDAIEEPLDAVARSVEHRAEASGDVPSPECSTRHQRLRCGGAASRHRKPCRRARWYWDAASRADVRNRTITGLSRRKHELERQAVSVGQRMDLGRRAAA